MLLSNPGQCLSSITLFFHTNHTHAHTHTHTHKHTHAQTRNHVSTLHIGLCRYRKLRSHLRLDVNNTKYSNTHCALCRRRGLVVCCDTCPRVVHLSCLPANHSRPTSGKPQPLLQAHRCLYSNRDVSWARPACGVPTPQPRSRLAVNHADCARAVVHCCNAACVQPLSRPSRVRLMRASAFTASANTCGPQH